MFSESLGWVVTTVLLVGMIGSYLAWTAGRVDRMHGRVEAARATLAAALQRRSGVAIEIATSNVLDPASAVLVADSAHRAREAPPGTEEQAESDLSRALVAAFPAHDASHEEHGLEPYQVPAEPSLYGELVEATKRVQLARRFYNDAVRATNGLRRHRLVRWLHLAGRAPLPEPVDFDDRTPPGLSA